MDTYPTTRDPQRQGERRGRDHRALAWTLVGLGCGLPSAVAATLGLHVTRVSAAALAVLAAVATWVFARPDRRPVRGLATVMILLAVFLHVGLHVLRAPAGGVAPFTGGPVWRQLVAWQVLSAGVTIALLCTRRVRDSGLLAIGDLDAPAAPIPWLNHRVARPWRALARELAVVLTTVTLVALLLAGGFDATSPPKVLIALPLAISLAAVNALNEELQFRVGVIAATLPVLGSRGAALTSAFMFGSWHYAGTPGGWAGVALAGLVGWLWARSTIETRGVGVAVGLHLLQDVVIFAAVLA